MWISFFIILLIIINHRRTEHRRLCIPHHRHVPQHSVHLLSRCCCYGPNVCHSNALHVRETRDITTRMGSSDVVVVDGDGVGESYPGSGETHFHIACGVYGLPCTCCCNDILICMYFSRFHFSFLFGMRLQVFMGHTKIMLLLLHTASG